MNPDAGIINYGKSTIASGPVNLASPIPLQNLKDRTVLITGGASGFGEGIARSLASQGAIVIIGDINEKLAVKVVADLRRTSGSDRHAFFRLDVTNWDSQIAFFKQAIQLSGRIDCVIANAGIADLPEQVAFENPPDYRNTPRPPKPAFKTIDVNLEGVLMTTTIAISYLSRNPKDSACSLSPSSTPSDRHLLLVASIAGMAPIPINPLYCASKHAVVGLFRSLRMTQPITNGIRINMLNPYFVDTPIMGSDGAFVLAGGAMAKIEDVVEAAVRCIADKAIIGRAFQIGTRATREQNKQAGLNPDIDGQAIWDVCGHDFEQSDVFTRRVIAATNIVTAARGWTGMIVDVISKVISPLRTMIGL